MEKAAAIKHETKHCPRCSQPFECKSGSIAQCQCAGIHLPDDVAAFVSEKYTDCLCRACLLQLQNKALFFLEKFKELP